MDNKELKDKIANILKDYTKENHIMASHAILESYADALIANGMTIRERGEWIKRTPCSEPECSKCGRCPKLVFGMLPDFCPHCGRDMRGMKDEQAD